MKNVTDVCNRGASVSARGQAVILFSYGRDGDEFVFEMQSDTEEQARKTNGR